jgi:2,3-bisphosphoglycerate-independent phosphoglycerate mutase
MAPSCCILILLDGLGDRSFAELGQRTPLQAAHTPNLDKIATLGANGLMHCGRQGMALPSENAHFSLFGYRQEEFPGRGYLEALGADIPVAEQETAFLAHLSQVKVDQNTLVLEKDRPGLQQREVAPLFDAVKEYSHKNLGCRLVPTRGVDAILLVDAPSSRYVTDTLPFYEGLPLVEPEPLDEYSTDQVALHTVELLKAYQIWAHKILNDHPLNLARKKEGKIVLNGVLTLRPGQRRTVEQFSRRWGLKGLSIATGLIYWGLAQFTGMDTIKVKDGSDPGDDIHERLLQAVRLAKQYEFIHVHSKVPDDAAHSKDYRKKVAAIESLDRGIGRILDSLINEQILFIVTSDHSTPSSGRLIHSGEPVPIAMVGKGMRRDAVRLFNEVDCAGGSLGFVQGGNLMYLVLNALDRIKLSGLNDTPHSQPFWPGSRKPFQLG